MPQEQSSCWTSSRYISNPLQDFHKVLTRGTKVQTSCGYGVPRLSINLPQNPAKDPEAAFEDRDTLGHSATKLVEKNGVEAYRIKNNAYSLDKLTAMRTARKDSGERLWLGDLKASARRIMAQREALTAGILVGILLSLILRFGQAFLVSS
jgi:hypothetical protein